MSLADAALTVIVSLAGSASMTGVYLKLSEQWLNQKANQVRELTDSKFFTLVDKLGAVCKAQRLYTRKKPDDPITTDEYRALLDSISDIKGPLDEYTRLNGCLFRMSRRLRSGAMLWIAIFVVVLIWYALSHYIAMTGQLIVLQGVDVGPALSLCSALVIVVLLAVALVPFFSSLRELNSIDKESESIERIRTWKRHT